MKTECFNNIANEAIYKLQYYKILYLAHKKINEMILILLSTITVYLIAIHVYCYLKF